MAGWLKKRSREEEQIEERTDTLHTGKGINDSGEMGPIQFICRADLQSQTSTVNVSVCFFLLKMADAVSSSTAAGRSNSK